MGIEAECIIAFGLKRSSSRNSASESAEFSEPACWPGLVVMEREFENNSPLVISVYKNMQVCWEPSALVSLSGAMLRFWTKELQVSILRLSPVPSSIVIYN